MAKSDKEIVFVKVAPAMKKQLRAASTVLSDIKSMDVGISDIVREAINEKLERIARAHPEIRAA